MKTIVTDSWQGIDCDEVLIKAPRISDVVTAIKALDAQIRTMVTLRGDGAEHMTVGGGGGKYVVYATKQTDQFFNLLGEEDAQGQVFLFIGGQRGDYPARQVVGLEQAIAAANTFAETGELDSGQRWEEQR